MIKLLNSKAYNRYFDCQGQGKLSLRGMLRWLFIYYIQYVLL